MKTNERLYIEKKCQDHGIKINDTISDQDALVMLYEKNVKEKITNKSIFIEWKLSKDGLPYETVCEMEREISAQYLAAVEKEKADSILSLC